MENLAMLIGLGVGALAFLIIALTLSPFKIFTSSRVNMFCGLALYIFGALTLGAMIYNCITAYSTKMLIICIAIIVVTGFFGYFLITVAKQDINIEARDKEAKKQANANKVILTRCPYCGCKLNSSDVTCPNCKSKVNG